MLFIFRFNLDEVISALEDDDFQSADIFISPPEDPTRSDEDSGPEDDDGDVNNLTGNQLRSIAEATIKMSNMESKQLGDLLDIDCTEDADNDSLSTPPPKMCKQLETPKSGNTSRFSLRKGRSSVLMNSVQKENNQNVKVGQEGFQKRRKYQIYENG